MAADVKKSVNTTTAVIIVLAIVAVLNLISMNVFGRLDLTDNDIYSLSEASKELMRNLNDRVVIKCYFTEDLPPPYNQNARYLKDQLADYRSYSGGMLEFEFIDPARDGKEEEAQGYQVPPVQVNAYENDRLEIKKVYMGIVFMHEDKTEVLPVFESTAGLEYEISRSIKKVTEDRTPRVAFTTGHGEPDFQQGLRVVNQALSREYSVQQLNTQNINEIPDNIDALLITYPKQPFTEWELFVIDQYIMHGGKVGVFVDRYDPQIQTNTTDSIDANLEPLLSHYGVGLGEGLVLDARCSRIAVQQQSGGFRIQNMIEYRFFPMVTNLDQENMIVKGLDAINLIFVSPLDTTVTPPEGVERSIFAHSSEYSAIENPPFNLSPFREFTRADFDRQFIPLAATLTGSFPSFFAGRGIPQYTGTDTAFSVESTVRKDSSTTTRMVVIGDGNFVDDRNMSSQNNVVFFMNVVDWLSQDEGLISIRSKQVEMRPLEDVSDGTRRFVKYLNLFGLPILVIVVGVVRWRARTASKRRRAL